MSPYPSPHLPSPPLPSTPLLSLPCLPSSPFSALPPLLPLPSPGCTQKAEAKKWPRNLPVWYTEVCVSVANSVYRGVSVSLSACPFRAASSASLSLSICPCESLSVRVNFYRSLTLSLTQSRKHTLLSHKNTHYSANTQHTLLSKHSTTFTLELLNPPPPLVHCTS